MRPVRRFMFLAGMLLICAGCATAPAGSAPGNSAPALALPVSTRVLGQATVYVSTAGEMLQVVRDPLAGVAIVKLPAGEVVVLPEEIAGNVGRYRDSRMTVWENDGGVMLWRDGVLVFSGRAAN